LGSKFLVQISVSQPTGRGRFLVGREIFSQKYKMSPNGQFIGYLVKEKFEIYPNVYIFEHFKAFLLEGGRKNWPNRLPYVRIGLLFFRDPGCGKKRVAE
jgi:hypothetical protein